MSKNRFDFKRRNLLTLNLDTLMAQAYEQKKDPDGFLYITYTEESTLGAADLQ